MPKPRKLRVFLCHASQHKLVARELYQPLSTEAWIDSWQDEEEFSQISIGTWKLRKPWK